MTVRWRKLGRIYGPDGTQAWARSHAMIPTPLMLSDEIVRLYIGCLDSNSVGRIGYVDVALDDPARPIRVSQEPVLGIGEAGTFDDNGVVPSCVTRVGGQLRFYYSGFQLQQKIPYTIFSSIALGESPDGPFRRASSVPAVDRCDGERFFRAAPFVLRDGNIWRMWYIGGSGWTDAGDGKMIPLYSMRQTTSYDGLVWDDRSSECLVPQGDETGFGRPFVVRDGEKYRLWYSIRSKSGYRPGYAESRDGLKWTRMDSAVNISVSPDGWDSEMLCYMAVVRAGTHWLAFYNGNGYGRTGVGVAVSEDG